MIFFFCFVLFSSLFAPAVQGQPFDSYAGPNQFLLTSPSSLGSGLQGYVNPALLNYVDRMETVFAWSAAPDHPHGTNQWGWFTGLPHLGFGVVHRELPGADLYDYRMSLSAGDRTTGLGLGYSWSSGQTDLLQRKNSFVVGALLRPSPRLSLGLTFTTTLSTAAREGTLDLALRPLGNERLTDLAFELRVVGTGCRRDRVEEAGSGIGQVGLQSLSATSLRAIQVDVVRRDGREDLAPFTGTGDEHVESPLAAFVIQWTEAHRHVARAVFRVSD